MSKLDIIEGELHDISQQLIVIKELYEKIISEIENSDENIKFYLNEISKQNIEIAEILHNIEAKI